MQAFPASRAGRMRGFTLIEIMVVVVIIGLLAAIVAPNVMRQLDRAMVTRAEADIQSLNGSLKLFRLDHYRYPTEDEGLAILTGEATAGSDIDESRLEKVIESLPKDPWDRDYQYRIPGEHGDYDIFSYGADGEEGGDDLDADIGNWTLDE